MRPGLLHQLLQRLLSSERACSGTGAHTCAILRDAAQLDQILLHQERQDLRDQAVDHRGLLAAKVAERVITHSHPTTDPTIGRVQLRQALDLARTAFTLAGGIHPQAQQNLGVDGGGSGDFIACFDLRVQSRQVQLLDHGPDGARGMVLR